MPKKITEAQIQTHLQTLRETPRRITTAVEGLDEVRLSTRPGRDEWSLVEILAHVRCSAEVWGYSIYGMLVLDNAELADIHRRAWAKVQRYETLTFAENLLAFRVQRRNLLRILEGLSFEEWGRSCSFTGKVNTHTIFSQALRMALHELDHCQQIEARVAAG